MAYVRSEPTASPLTSGAFKAQWAALRDAFSTYRHKRAIYLNTMRELQSYRPHELQDLRIHPADFELLARKQAGL